MEHRATVAFAFVSAWCARASDPYALEPRIESRSISFENPTGEKGAGGKAASKLGVGRKGSPAKELAPGETVTLCGTGSDDYVGLS